MAEQYTARTNRRDRRSGPGVDKGAAERPSAQPPAARSLRDSLGNTEAVAALSEPAAGGLAAVVQGQAMAAAAGVPQPSPGNAVMAQAMRRQAGEAGAAASLAGLRGAAGAPLPAPVRARMERAFGHDFGHVRVHVGADAATAAERLGAHAFALGADIYFGRGTWAPGTEGGDRLLAHELTHVVQGDEGRLGGPTGGEQVGGVEVSSPHDPEEREAYRNEQVILGRLHQVDRELAAGPAGPAAPLASEATAEVAGSPGGAEAPAMVAAPAMRQANPHASLPGDRSTGPDAQGDDAALEEGLTDDDLAAELQWLQALSLLEPEIAASPEVPPAPDASAADGSTPEVDPPAPETAAQSTSPAPDVPPPPELPSTSASQAPAAGSAPSPSPTPAVDLPEPDQVVDHYMEVHWDRSERDALVDQHDLAFAVDGLVETLLPSDVSPEARRAASITYAMHAGLFDTVALTVAKTIPGVGTLVHIGSGIQAHLGAVDDYALNADTADARKLFIKQLHSNFDTASSLIANLTDLITASQIASAAIPSGVTQALAAVKAVCGSTGNGMVAVLDALKLACSTLLLAANVADANAAEARGEFRKAAALRSLAHGDAVRVVTESIELALTVLSISTGNVAPNGAPRDIARGVRDLPGKVLQGVTGVNKDGGIPGAIGTLIGRGNGGGLLRATQPYDDLMYRIGLGDAMRLSPDGLLGGHYINPEHLDAGGVAGGLLMSARQATVARFGEVHGDLESAPDPTWTVQALRQLLDPSDPSAFDALRQGLDELMSPSGRLVAQVESTLGLFDYASTQGLADLYGGREAAVAGAEALWDLLAEHLATWKEELEVTLLTLTEAMADQEDVARSLREALGNADALLAQVQGVAAAEGQLDGLVSGAIGQLDAARVSPDDLDLPAWLPPQAASVAAGGVNATIDGLAEQLLGTAESVRQPLDSFVHDQTAWARAHIQLLHGVLDEGSDVQQLLQRSYEELTASSQQLAQAFAEWDPSVRPDFDEWLEELRAMRKGREDVSHGNRLQALQQEVARVGVPAMEAWKTDHGESVEGAFAPAVPAEEWEAVQRAYGMIAGRFDENINGAPELEGYLGPYRARADDAFARASVLATSGQTGAATLHAFWRAVDDLAEVGAIVNA